ncbi:MAG: leucyl aminopeptidase, partial [Candidatus Obscuribacterales bacterium]|nr:leucyl aminopeptidase [Candidatus Obscuribacterales bacterium]
GVKGETAQAVDELTNGLISRRLEHDGFDPKYKQSKVIDTDLTVEGLDKIVLVGLGSRSKIKLPGFRAVLAEAFVSARDTAQAEHLIFPLIDVDLKGFTIEQFAQTVAEYAVLVDYEPNHQKTRPWLDEAETTHFKSLTLLADRTTLSAAKRGAKYGQQVAEATVLARNLVNEPAKTMTAQKLSRIARRVASKSGGLVTCNVLGRKSIEDLGMGGLLAVNRGSKNPPTFITLSYDPASGPTEEILALVGKGVTFDTGGLNAKDYESMKNMKMDMAGGAAVIAAMSLMSVLKPCVSVRAVVAATDNLISRDAMLQDEVIKSMSGLTVEVGHTDCEGRLTLMDAIHYAQTKLGATKVVDLATLTGAIEEALGVYVTGVFGNDDRFSRKFIEAADRAGEDMYLLPMPDVYRDGNKTSMADLTNDGAGPGAIIAAWFLREFVKEGVSWIHCDIAGTAFHTEATAFGIEAVGGTGAGVRALAQLLRSYGC